MRGMASNNVTDNLYGKGWDVFHLGGFPVILRLGGRATHCSLLGNEELHRLGAYRLFGDHSGIPDLIPLHYHFHFTDKDVGNQRDADEAF